MRDEGARVTRPPGWASSAKSGDESSCVLNGDARPFEHAELNRRVASGFNDIWACKKKVTGTGAAPR